MFSFFLQQVRPPPSALRGGGSDQASLKIGITAPGAGNDLNRLREVGSAGVGWRDGEKRHTTVIE